IYPTVTTTHFCRRVAGEAVDLFELSNTPKPARGHRAMMTGRPVWRGAVLSLMRHGTFPKGRLLFGYLST
ncbi:MAG: hypothetical protein ACRD1T_15390, partial [Acidimicrobiia bacterium]